MGKQAGEMPCRRKAVAAALVVAALALNGCGVVIAAGAGAAAGYIVANEEKDD